MACYFKICGREEILVPNKDEIFNVKSHATTYLSVKCLCSPCIALSGLRTVRQCLHAKTFNTETVNFLNELIVSLTS